MLRLPVIVHGDTFASLWSDLAARHGLELMLMTSPEVGLAPHPNLLPSILVISGRESSAEADLEVLRAAGLPGPLVVGSSPDHRLAISLLRAGASDYFCLPADLDVLGSTVAAIVDRVRGRSDRTRLLDASRSQYDFTQIIGRSAAVRAALDRAARIIPHDRASVLVTGETGTGKELVARAIHFNGPRAAEAFVDINCAAIPGTLLESELFGYERGAFTDARSAKPGLFEAATGGTLFLDEIGHMPVVLQGKLLKALDEKRIRRLGSLEMREVDVRIIAATHVDLVAAVQRGEFREDLYYRLAVIPIHLPSLRERGDDVLLLAEHFLLRLAEQYRLEAPPMPGAFRSALVTHTWPGNVRELRNAIERALLLGGDRLDPADLFAGPNSATAHDATAIPFPAPLDVIEREAARRMLVHAEGNKSAAAAALGISRSRLYRLLDEAEPLPDPVVEPPLPQS